MDLKPLCQRVDDRLGIDPLDIKFEEMIDDSRLYIKEEYVAINKKYEELSYQYEADKNALDKTLEKRAYKQAQEIKMKAYLKEIKKADNYLPEWSIDLWMLMVDSAIVNRNKTITFKFTSGTEITV